MSDNPVIRFLGKIGDAIGVTEPVAPLSERVTAATTPIVLTPTSGGSITDVQGNIWTLSASGAVEENGRAIPGGAGTSQVTYVNSILWAKGSADNTWYTYANGFWMNQGSATPSGPLTPPAKIPPSQALAVRAIASSPMSITLSWTEPKTGTKPFGYTVFSRVHGTSAWGVGATSTTTTAVVSGLRPNTPYDFEVSTHN